MVKLMLDGFGGNQRKPNAFPPAASYNIECYRVNVRLSKQLEDIGEMRIGKFVLLLFRNFASLAAAFHSLEQNNSRRALLPVPTR
jgi:hypothetical protein